LGVLRSDNKALDKDDLSRTTPEAAVEVEAAGGGAGAGGTLASTWQATGSWTIACVDVKVGSGAEISRRLRRKVPPTKETSVESM